MNGNTFGSGIKFPNIVLAGLALVLALSIAPTAQAEVCNIRVVTDGNPDYTDIGSMIYSIASNWNEDKDKAWAVFYWNHIARRQTAPMHQHGINVTDPIRQFNDYGYTMCSTISGVNCGIFAVMGYEVRFWDISMHTVMDVKYDGAFHMYDNSLSALYTKCDGKTLAAVDEIGQDGACDASGGKVEPGHIAKYHCLYASSPNGYLIGCDGIRSVAEEYKCFNPKGLKYRWYFHNWDLGHRYILNLRDNEVYARYYRRLDADSPNAVVQNDKRAEFKADPAYFVPNENTGKDPESINPRYTIRGNGVRTYSPSLKAADLPNSADTISNIVAAAGGLQPAKAGEAGEVVFRIQGANVICSTAISASLNRKGADDIAAISVSADNGLHWKEVYKCDKTGADKAEFSVIEPVNGSYEVLVKVTLMGKAAAADASLNAISFKTITMLNSKTQPRLRLGKNTVYVGTGEQTEAIVLWPNLPQNKYKDMVVEEKNVCTTEKLFGYQANLRPSKPMEEGYVVYRVDSPGDITRLTYGGRVFVAGANARVEFQYSVDGGKNWISTYKCNDTSAPWDIIHYDKVEDIPAGTRSVLVKYIMAGGHAGMVGSDKPMPVGIYADRMEVNYKPADTAFKPMEVTYTWKEVKDDNSTVTRSHTQFVEKVPFTYEINVGGVDHPIMESLQLNLKGAAGGDVKYGYSDGVENKDAKKFQDRWVTYGKILSTGKPYTCSVKPSTEFGNGDKDSKLFTDGVVGSTYTGGASYAVEAQFKKGDPPEIVVDLGQKEKCGAFRIQFGGSPFWDALKGQIQDKVEVLVSTDNKEFTSAGNFNFHLRWKDLPVNFMWPDEETLKAPNYELILDKPVEAQYVKFKIAPARILMLSEVQALESIEYKPFDMKLALPDGKDRSDITQYNPKHIPSKSGG